MKIVRILLVLGVLLVLTATAVSADAPGGPSRVGRAMFEDYPDCLIFDVNFDWYYVEDCSPTISLITNSQKDVKHWHARAQLPPGAVLPEQAAVHITYENSGFACWWGPGVETTNYTITITPHGKFIISCHFRPDKWQPE